MIRPLPIARLFLSLSLGLLVLVTLVDTKPARAGVYDADTPVTYKEYWVSHAEFDGTCPPQGAPAYYFEPSELGGACVKNLDLNIPDNFNNALKVEIFIDLWRNRDTQSARFQINQGEVRAPNVGSDWSRTPYIAEIPKAELQQGNNVIKFWNTNGRLYHGHDVAIRIYYDGAHPLLPGSGSDVTPPTAALTSIIADNGSFTPNAGGSLIVNSNQLRLQASASGADYVEFHAYYEGYDEDNDGQFRDWHNVTRNNCQPGGVEVLPPNNWDGCRRDLLPLGGAMNHIGTIDPDVTNEVVWGLDHITNQAGVRFKVRAIDAAGNVAEAAGGVSAPFALLRDGPTAAFVIPDFDDAGLYMGGSEPNSVTYQLNLPDLALYSKAYLIGAFWRNPYIAVNTSGNSDAFKPNGTEDWWKLSVRDTVKDGTGGVVQLYTQLLSGTNTLVYTHRSSFGEFIEKPGPMIVLKRTGTGFTDSAPPTYSNHTPAPGATEVGVNAPLALDVTDISGINIQTLAMSVNGVTVTPQSSGFNHNYGLSYTPSPPLPFSTVINVQVNACDLRNNCNTESYSFTTGAQDLTPPLIGNVQVTPGFNTATISWTTDEPANSRVDYGLTSAYDTNKTDDAYVTQHALLLTGLTPNTDYHYQITSLDDSNNSAQTVDAIFHTQTLIQVISDDFNTCLLNPNLWQFINPRGDATLTLAGHELKLRVPAGIEHDAFPKNGESILNRAPRIMQPATNPDGFRVRFETGVNQPIQVQGVIIEQDDNNFLRFSFQHENGVTFLKSFKVINGVGSNATAPVQIFAGPTDGTLIMTVTRNEVDNKWAIFYDLGEVKEGHDGRTSFFTLPINVTRVGVFAGNAGNNPPAFEAVIDYAFSVYAPVSPEDSNALFLPVSATPVGAGVVTKSVECGNPITLTATANAGWTFSEWIGSYTSNENPKPINFAPGSAVTARFTQNRYTLTVNTVGIGSVTRSPDKPTYVYGEQVTLTAMPGSGQMLTAWSDGLTGNPTTITIDDNEVIEATFAPAQFTLQTQASGNGTIAVTPEMPSYGSGEQASLTATPATGWRFTGWSGSASSSFNPLIVTLDTNKSITANFEQTRYSVGLSVVGNGSVSPNLPPNSYMYNDVATLAATPDLGWRFAGWAGDLSGATSPASLTIDKDQAVVAVFIQDQYVLQANAEGQGIVAWSPAQASYAYGSIVVLSPTPHSGAIFDNWSGDLSGAANPATLTIDHNKSVTATFTSAGQATFGLTLTANPAAGGTVAASPAQTSFPNGALVTLTATPSPGYVFIRWEGSLVSAANPASLLMDGNKTVTAIFTPATTAHRLTITIVGSGAVTRNPEQNLYTFGQRVQLTAVPEPGWAFAGWSGALSGSKLRLPLIMNGDQTVTATFTQDPVSLVVTPQGNGTVTIEPQKEQYAPGEEVTLTAQPAAGWVFVAWSDDLLGTTNPVTIQMDQNKMITAIFAELKIYLPMIAR